MTYEEYIDLGPEDRMRARLNDLALAAARQEPLKTSLADAEYPEVGPELKAKVAQVRKFTRPTAKAKARAFKGKRGTVDFGSQAKKVRHIPVRSSLESISRNVGVGVADVQRVIEAYEHLDTDKKQ